MEDMFENIDELIEINLKLLAESTNRSLFIFDFVDTNGKNFMNPDRFAESMESKGLIDIEYSKRQRCDLTENGYKIWNSGGWIKYLEYSEELEKKEQLDQQQKENLEEELAKSNIEANKLNKQVAVQNAQNEKKNRVTMWINIGIGILNLGLLTWQILKNS